MKKYLGKDFEVKSCYGHIRDLGKGIWALISRIILNPRYIVPEDKEKVVKELKSLARKNPTKYGWQRMRTVKEKPSAGICAKYWALIQKPTKRIVFHEITKPAIQNAVENPRTVDMNLVNAQQARRILDRIVGFELSPVLWRKMSMRNNLSAGRVQSVAVRIIAEREREINAFTAQSTFKIEAFFTANDISGKNVVFKAEGKKYADESDAEKFLKSCIGANYTVRIYR